MSQFLVLAFIFLKGTIQGMVQELFISNLIS